MRVVRVLLVVAAAWSIAGASFWATPANAAELIMYRRAGCPWCAIWDREIGPIYGKTDIGSRVPIRFVHLERKERPELLLRSPIRFSPTFVLVESGREIGRIDGYPGEDFFWGLLERLVEHLPGKLSMGSADTKEN